MKYILLAVVFVVLSYAQNQPPVFYFNIYRIIFFIISI
jgi:hypothetical protein